MGFLRVLVFFLKKLEQGFKAEPQRDVVGVRARICMLGQTSLVNNAAYEYEIAVLNDFGQLVQKSGTFFQAPENIESALFLSDLIFTC